MKTVLKIWLILLVTTSAFSEIISDGVGIDKLKYGRSVNRGGYYLGYGFNMGDLQNMSSDTIDYSHRVDFTYGIADGIDISFSLPFHSFIRGSLNKYNGFGDIALGAKYNFISSGSDFNHSIFGELTLPTGYSESDSAGITELFTISKKGYEVGYLLDWGKDIFSIHLNLSYFTKDNFVNDNLYDMGFKYGIGAKYRAFQFFERNIFLKWSFNTTNWLYEAPNYIDGSTYAGASIDIFAGLNCEVGYSSLLYDKSGSKLHLSLSYSDFGSKRAKVIKPMDNYPPKVKVDLIKFENEDSLKTDREITEEVAKKLDSLDEIDYRVLDIDGIDIFENREGSTELLNQQERDIAIQGRVKSSKFIKSSLFWIPFVIDVPRVGYHIVIEFIAVDLKSGKIVYKDEIESTAYRYNRNVYLRYEANSAVNRISISEESLLKDEARTKIANALLKEIYSKVD